MYPEYIAMDLTFGTNVQRRPLFAVAGIDGRNHTFPLLRAFLPSKECIALRWVILKALPTLLGRDVLDHVSVIASDMEDSICQSIATGINSGLFPKARHRLDYYHIFVQPWMRYIRSENSITKTVFMWIKSWFDQVEKVSEFKKSLNLLQRYISVHENDMGDILVGALQEIIDRIVGRISYCGNHYFLENTTFGYKGDSIVESMNSSMKYGAIPIDSRMGVDRSAFTQMNMAIRQARSKNMYVLLINFIFFLAL